MVKVLSIETADKVNFQQYGALNFDDAVEVIEEVLGLNHNDIEAIQKFGPSPRRIDFSLTNEAFERDGVQSALDETTRLSTGKVIIVGLPNQIITDVYIKYSPLEWTKERLERIFSYYGDIKVTDRMSIKESEIKKSNYVGKGNGIIKMKMKIRKPVPSTLNIDGSRIEVFYKNQSRTCWRCGGGHMKYRCETAPRNFINRFSLEDFPPIGGAARASLSAQQQADENMEEESVEGSETAETPQPSDVTDLAAETPQPNNTSIVASDTLQANEEIEEPQTTVTAAALQNTVETEEQGKGTEATEATQAKVATVTQQEVKMETTEETGAAEASQANAENVQLEAHKEQNEPESETTITASEGEDFNLPTPGQQVKQVESCEEDSLMCEAAAEQELQPTPIDFLLSETSLMDQDEEDLTVFRSKKRTTGSSTEEEIIDIDKKSTNGESSTPLSSSGHKKAKQFKLDE